jgi:hypothetical protein
MDPTALTVLVIAVAFLVTTLAAVPLAYLLGSRRRRKDDAPGAARKPDDCGCDHNLALHDLGSNECHGELERPHYDSRGNRNGNQWTRCPCRQFTGVRPLDLSYLTGLQLPAPDGEQ